MTDIGLYLHCNAALTNTDYPLRMLKFENRAKITEYDANGWGGACRKRCICENVLKMTYACYERLQMPLQIMRTPCKHLTNEATAQRMLAELFLFVTYSQAI